MKEKEKVSSKIREKLMTKVEQSNGKRELDMKAVLS